MNDDQKTHVAQLADEFERRMAHKYTKGAQEHGGNLWEVPSLQLLDEAIDEAIDQVVYLLTLRKQLEVNRPSDIRPIKVNEWIDGFKASNVVPE